MDFSHLITSIVTALGCLQSRWEHSISGPDKIQFESMMIGLRIVRTFLLCSTILANDVQLRTADNQTGTVPNTQNRKRMIRLRFGRTFVSCPTALAKNIQLKIEGIHDAVPTAETRIWKMKQKKRSMRNALGPFLLRIEDVICKILDDQFSYEAVVFRYIMGSWKEIMDKSYARLSDYLHRYSTSPVGSQMKVIADSVLGNLQDYLSSKTSLDQLSDSNVQQIDALKKNITFARNFICFGTLFGAENQEFQGFLTHMQPLVVGAAHLVQSLFSNIGRQGTAHFPEYLGISNMPALLFTINHVENPFLHMRYTLALTSLKQSGNLLYSTLDLNNDPLLLIMEDFIVSLLSTLWEMLQWTTHHLVSLKGIVQVLYQGLRLLRTLVKKQPNKFDDEKIRDIAVAAICDAGVIIFSLCQKDFVIDHRLFKKYQDNIVVIRAELVEELVVGTPRSKYSETNVLGFLDFLLEDYLTEVKSSSTPSFVPKIREYLVFLNSIMGKCMELWKQQEILHQDLWYLSVEVAYKIELLIDQLVLGDFLDSLSMSLESITEDIMTIEADSLQILNEDGSQEIYKVQQITWPSTDKVPPTSSRPVADDVVGFENEKASIVNRLLTGFKKLQVVAIVGMPGLGKTTLATKVYSTPSIYHHFHVKAWCSISQVFDRRKVLLELLNQIQPGKSDSTMEEDDLSQQLWRSLRKRKYLIFIDDIWDTKAFDLLKGSLPDDYNQSRILLTSRHGGVVPEASLDDKPLFLRHLTMDESLELLQRKLFPAQKDWPPELYEVGIEIAKYCKGLPLTVVIIAGLLRSTEQEGWQEVLKNFRSNIISDVTGQCESTIELSYEHLPDHLKLCFLWFGAYPEDHEFIVKKLMWLWIAEGLVRRSEAKSLEAVVVDYLEILIRRSLVMSVKERATGSLKTCRIHDLLHDFCFRKASEDCILHLLKVKRDGKQGYLSSDKFEISSFEESVNWRKLCVYSEPHHLQDCKYFSPQLRSLLFFAHHKPSELLFFSPRFDDVSFIFRIYKLLRVLDMEQLYLQAWPNEVELLVQLRFLAIKFDGLVPPAICRLSNLETLILISSQGLVCLPDTLWNLRKLRHLHSKEYCSIELPIDDHDSSSNLLELETLSTLHVEDWSVLEKQLRKFPNIRQIKLSFLNKSYGVRDVSFLSQLESLSLSCITRINSYDTPSFEFVLPENIKKLTLRGTHLPWDKIATIAKLPGTQATWGVLLWEYMAC